MDWSWAITGINDEIPRTAGPECINYMTNRRRWIESLLLGLVFIYLIHWAAKRMDPIIVPSSKEINKPHSAVRLLLMIFMTFIFGVEMGFKFANKNMIYVLNPCHIQTLVQIYLLAAKPSKTTIALFRIQMNNLNGPVLAFLFPEVECRTLHFEQATYWIQHALLYLIPVYILKSGAYQIEDFNDYNWTTIGTATMLLYHFAFLSTLSMFTGINLSHMLCAALSDPFQGPNYRIAATIHEMFLCPILNKGTVLLFSKPTAVSKVTKLKQNLELRINADRRASTDDALLTAHLCYTRAQLSKSVPTTPSSLTPTAASSPITEISLVGEMAAAGVGGTGPVTLMRRLKRNSISIVASGNVDKVVTDSPEVNNRFGFQNGEHTNVKTATYAEYATPIIKMD